MANWSASRTSCRLSCLMGWEWTRLGSVGTTNIGLTYKPSDVSTTGTRYFALVISRQIASYGMMSYVLIKRSRVNCFFMKNDLLICARNGSRALVGKCVLIPRIDRQLSFGAFMAVFRSTLNQYLCYLLRAQMFQSYMDGSNSTAISQLTQSMLKEFPVPIPPSLRQQRIVDALDRYLALVDDIERDQTDLDELLAKMRSKVSTSPSAVSSFRRTRPTSPRQSSLSASTPRRSRWSVMASSNPRTLRMTQSYSLVMITLIMNETQSRI